MKRRILIAALALVLAVGGIAALNIHTAKKATPIEMQVVDSIGDASTAQGLLVDYRIMLGTTLQWYTTYDPATGGNDTGFYVTYRTGTGGFVRYSYPKFNETCLACSAVDAHNMNDPIVKDMWAASEDGYAARRLYPIDYYDTYPVYLTSSWGLDGLTTDYQAELAFDKLRIPVGTYDFLELSLDFGTDINGEAMVSTVGTGNQYMQNRFTPYYISGDDRVLVTAGFPADVEPQADWAPEGFGLWDIPVRETREKESGGYAVRYLPVTAESRLVYPLDIETQRVALLEQSDDGAYILLVTVENDRYVLRVLDSADYHLVQTLDIDGAEIREVTSRVYVSEAEFGPYRPTMESVRYQYNPPTDGDDGWFQLEEQFYPAVGMQQGDGFLVLVMGSRVALLTPDGEKGYKGEFVCDAPDYSSIEINNTVEGRYFLYHDERDEVEAESYDAFSPIPTADAAYSMAYNGRYLAMASYVDDRDLLVSVFGKDGLQYAACVRSSLVGQPGTGNCVFSASWEGVDMYDINDIPRPRLAWQS